MQCGSIPVYLCTPLKVNLDLDVPGTPVGSHLVAFWRVEGSRRCNLVWHLSKMHADLTHVVCVTLSVTI